MLTQKENIKQERRLHRREKKRIYYRGEQKGILRLIVKGNLNGQLCGQFREPPGIIQQEESEPWDGQLPPRLLHF